MNFVFLSPHFPPNFRLFCQRLSYLGVTVLGIADEPYENLHPDLKSALTEYYWVPDMHIYDDLLRGLGYFTHRYGRIDRLDSMNEYWLETEARLRTDFNVPGIRYEDIMRVKRKSAMKAVFLEAGVAAAGGRLAKDLADARRLVDEIGYPIVAKPDIGVGAAKTYKIHTDEQLASFFAQKPRVDYILEEFVDGTIQTFDVRERFFHFEFFRTRDNRIVALEVNMRPPGGLTTDMFNYAND